MATKKKTTVKSTVKQSKPAKCGKKVSPASAAKKSVPAKAKAASSKSTVKKSAVKDSSKATSKKAAKTAAKKDSKVVKASAKAAPKSVAKVSKTASKAAVKKLPKNTVSKSAKAMPAEKAEDRVSSKRVPPKMKKMVVKSSQSQTDEDLYENNAKDFAFAFAESIKRECEVVEAKKSADAAKNAVRLTKRPTSRVKGSSTLKFSNSDLAQFRKTLLSLRLSIVGKTATLKTNALEQTIDRAGEDEDGSDSFMRLQNLGQVGEQNKVLQKIDEALHRIEDGSYGICEVCGQLIRKARLQHLPFAHTCMECQSAMESNSASPV